MSDPKQAIAKDIKKEIKTLQEQIKQIEEMLERGEVPEKKDEK